LPTPKVEKWWAQVSPQLNPLPYRSLQLGLAGETAARYADEWIAGIEDVTPLARQVHGLVRAGELERAAELLPEERPYLLDDTMPAHLRG
jgi:hypothetical protein